jgi:hypothetical protein
VKPFIQSPIHPKKEEKEEEAEKEEEEEQDNMVWESDMAE